MAEYLAETESAINFLTEGISRIRDELVQAARNVAVTWGSGQDLPPGDIRLTKVDPISRSTGLTRTSQRLARRP